MTPAASRALAAVRREVGRRAGAGAEDAGLGVTQVAAVLEADPGDRALLDEVAEARLRADPPELPGHAPSARDRRERRAEASREALGELILAGELVPDGPDRVRLPGFGATTWRAIALLREGAGGGPARWAAAVAAEPASDLAEAAPAALRDLRPDPALARAAARLHALEALRQDARHALLASTAAMGAALDAGHADSARSLRADCDELQARIAEADAAIEAAWEDGQRRAGLSPR